ncbi:MAG: hypothetical protein HYS55_02950 [Candidatus Omnitrophica bacterium]|nr:hypothetical protein [Candidatus Omnitrophota bacterium]
MVFQQTKKTVIKLCLLLSVFSLLFAMPAYAGAHKGPVYKFARGITYIVASPFQLPKEIIQVASEEESPWIAPWKGMSQGAGSGLYQMGRQGIAGIWDLFTFWTPADRDWKSLFDTSLFPEV